MFSGLSRNEPLVLNVVPKVKLDAIFLIGNGGSTTSETSLNEALNWRKFMSQRIIHKNAFLIL